MVNEYDAKGRVKVSGELIVDPFNTPLFVQREDGKEVPYKLPEKAEARQSESGLLPLGFE